jgi:hypothetical protein
MRTGTSLLQSVLCSTEQTNKFTHECHYLTKQMHLFRARYQAFHPVDQAYFGSRVALADFTAGIVSSFLSLARAQHQTPKILVLKTPELTPYFPYLLQMLPEAKFVVSVREPKDTIASMITVGERQQQRGEPSHFQALARDMAQFVEYYKSYYAPLFEHLNNAEAGARERVMLASYERLLTETPNALAALSKFSGIDLSRFNKAATWRSEIHGVDGNAKDGVVSAWQTELEGKGLSTQRLGRYAEVLTAREIQEIDAQSADVCRAFGYPSPATPIQSQTIGPRAVKVRQRKHA